MAEVKLKNIKKIYPLASDEKKNRKKDKEEQKKSNLQITKDGVVAVQEFSLDIKDKEFIVLVGPSGCGKSTTLRMIAGLEEISSGDLIINGKRCNDLSPKDRNIAMVFQNYALYAHMTVYHNLAFSLTIRKMDSDEIHKRVMQAANMLGLIPYLNRKPKQLSGGQRQRVAVGRAIVRNPIVYLLDEPLSNLDAKLRASMRKDLAQLHHNLNATFIYVTHDQIEAMTLGDRIVVMKDGFIQQVGTPQEVFNHPENLFVAGFIGTPQINFFHNCKLVNKNNECFVVINNKEIKLSEKQQQILKDKQMKETDVIVGIRPVHINISKEGFTGTIEVSEMMGSEVHLHVNIDGNDIVAVIPTANLDLDTVAIGKEITISFDPTLCHIFDSNSQTNILK